jgi:hypothetical protein
MSISLDSGGNRFQKHDQLLLELKIAVCLQIELWNAIGRLEELLPSDFDPLIWVQATSTIVDTGMELTMADVDDYLKACGEALARSSQWLT